MKKVIFLLYILLGTLSLKAQPSFTNERIIIDTPIGKSGFNVKIEDEGISFTFYKLNRIISLHEKYLLIDSQVILVTPLQVEDSTKDLISTNVESQEKLLREYSAYEIDYFRNELGLQIIDPQSQWVETKGRYWYIWYFKVGQMPSFKGKQTAVQLFASTFIEGRVLTLNAPIMEGGDFSSAAYIINDLMVALALVKK